MVNSKRKRSSVPLPAGTVSAWDLLRDALSVTNDRPAGSVTPGELADRMGVSHSRAAHILRTNKNLKPVRFRCGSQRQGVCYVPADKKKDVPR